MDFSFSKHAIERMKDRGISRRTVSLIVQHPDAVIKESDCLHIYQKIILQKDTKYLFRIFINVCKDTHLVITAYKTSKIDKYEY